MFWTEKLLLIVMFFQTLELWQIRRVFSEQSGIWKTSLLKSGPEWSSRFILRDQTWIGLLLLRLFILFFALVWPRPQHLAFLLITQFLIYFRFRGSFNGGSDSLTTLALVAVWISAAFPDHPLVQQACLLYLGLQVCLSYFVAGVAKVAHPDWRSGRALSRFLLSPKYLIPPWWRAQAEAKSPLLKLGTWGVLLFELSFPLAVLMPQILPVWLLIGAIFHFLNFQVFGLNRFFWVWLACYPALFECSVWISSHL